MCKVHNFLYNLKWSRFINFKSTGTVGSYVAIKKDGSSSIKPGLKFPSSKSNCTDLNKWHVISVTWSNKGENLSNSWSNDEKITKFTTGKAPITVI